MLNQAFTAWSGIADSSFVSRVVCRARNAQRAKINNQNALCIILLKQLFRKMAYLLGPDQNKLTYQKNINIVFNPY
jgi:hypothetical protein